MWSLPRARPTFLSAIRRITAFSRRRGWILVVLLCLTATGCDRGTPDKAATSPRAGADELAAQVASYDLAVGKQRFMLGLLTSEHQLVGWGTVSMKFVYLGTREAPTDSGQVVSEAQAGFLPIAREGGTPPTSRPGPAIVPAREGSGVYAAETSFDRAGFWGVQVDADVEGMGPRTAKATFEVLPSHRYPWVGEDAPRSQNLTLESKDAPPAAIDSRAQGGAPAPDPDLHSTTVASSLAEGKPVLLVVSTPVYCVSRFCGPVTDMVSELGKTYADRASFIHIEVWRDFENKEVNRAAAEWVLRDDDILEPWVFLVDADGKIVARWDNVSTKQEIEPALQALPAR